MTEARCWKVYHGLTEQLLAVYPGTPTADVLAAVRELFGFRETAPLRFRNVDGLPVAVSSHLPDNVALHVSVEAGFPLPPASSNPTGTVRRASAEPDASEGASELRLATVPDMARFLTGADRVLLGTTCIFNGGWAMTGPLPCTGRYTWLLQGGIGCCRGIGLLPSYYVNESSAMSKMCNHGGGPSPEDDFDYARFSIYNGSQSKMAIARVDFGRDEFVLVRVKEEAQNDNADPYRTGRQPRTPKRKWHGCDLTQGLNIKRLKLESFKFAMADMKHRGSLSIHEATDDILRRVHCNLDSFVQQYRQAAAQWIPGDAERSHRDSGRPPPTCLDFHDWTPAQPEALAELLPDY